MFVLLLILIPIIALVTWAVVFDLKRRRRHEPLTSHDVNSAAYRARADAHARGGGGPGGDGGAGAAPGM